MKKRTPIDALRTKIWIEGIRFETGLNTNQMDLRFDPQASVRRSTLKSIQNGRFAKMLRLGVLPDSGTRRDSPPGIVHEVDRISGRKLSERLFLPLWTFLQPGIIQSSGELESHYKTLPSDLTTQLILPITARPRGVDSHAIKWEEFWLLSKQLISDDVERLTLLVALHHDLRHGHGDFKIMAEKAARDLEVAIGENPVFGPYSAELFDWLYQNVFPKWFDRVN